MADADKEFKFRISVEQDGAEAFEETADGIEKLEGAVESSEAKLAEIDQRWIALTHRFEEIGQSGETVEGQIRAVNQAVEEFKADLSSMGELDEQAAFFRDQLAASADVAAEAFRELEAELTTLEQTAPLPEPPLRRMADSVDYVSQRSRRGREELEALAMALDYMPGAAGRAGSALRVFAAGGGLAAAIMAGLDLAIRGVGEAITYFGNEWEKVLEGPTQAVNDFHAAAARETFAAAQEFQDLEDSSAKAATRYSEALAASITNLQKRLDILSRTVALENQLDQAETAKALAEVDRKESEGKLSPEEAEKERQRLRSESEDRQFGREAEAEKERLEAAREQKRMADREVERIENELKSQRERNAYDEVPEKLRNEVGYATDDFNITKGIHGHDSVRTANAAAELAKANDAVERYRAQKQAEIDLETKSLEDELEAARKAQESARKEVEDQQRVVEDELPLKEKIHEAEKAGRETSDETALKGIRDREQKKAEQEEDKKKREAEKRDPFTAARDDIAGEVGGIVPAFDGASMNSVMGRAGERLQNAASQLRAAQNPEALRSMLQRLEVLVDTLVEHAELTGDGPTRDYQRLDQKIDHALSQIANLRNNRSN